MWDRHVLNCAVVADPSVGLLPPGSRVADIGTGAGLPGIVWAITRSDLQVVLIESLLRRVTFLTECVHELDLADRVHVVRSRAEELAGRAATWGGMDVVTARAVAPLGTIAEWAAPLTRTGGSLLAIKGSSAREELQRDAARLRGSGFIDPAVVEVGQGIVDPATTVVTASKAAAQ
jgi:16S rRNA (guanine527-N7)-methyltransferase